MFDLVLCLSSKVLSPSAEFAEGLRRLERQVGESCDWVYASAHTHNGPWTALLGDVAQRPDSDRVLCLTHAQVHVADESLQWLAAAADESSGLALCWSHAHAPPALPPAYCTARGLERYVRTLRRVQEVHTVTLPAPAWPAGFVAGAATLGVLRAWAAGQAMRACWVPGSFAHDFANYHQGHRPEMLEWVPQGVKRVLDVGGGEGRFLEELRRLRGCETHLSEFSESVCRAATGRVDHAWPGDFLELSPEVLTRHSQHAFDCVTFLDSLEHAAEPGLWLDKVHALLAEGGWVVGSIPNVGHWSVVADLLEGRWDYCPVGIHCNTHLRFFTRRTLVDLLQRHGFAVEAVGTTPVPAPPEWSRAWLATPGLQTDEAELDAYAFNFRARKCVGTRSTEDPKG